MGAACSDSGNPLVTPHAPVPAPNGARAERWANADPELKDFEEEGGGAAVEEVQRFLKPNGQCAGDTPSVYRKNQECERLGHPCPECGELSPRTHPSVLE